MHPADNGHLLLRSRAANPPGAMGVPGAERQRKTVSCPEKGSRGRMCEQTAHLRCALLSQICWS
jgi:hypothetical protein